MIVPGVFPCKPNMLMTPEHCALLQLLEARCRTSGKRSLGMIPAIPERKKFRFDSG